MNTSGKMRTMKKFWPLLMLLVIVMSMAIAAPAFTQTTPTLSAQHTQYDITAILTASDIDDGTPIIITLTDDTGQLYMLPAIKTSATTWQATFPVSTTTTEITAEQGTTTLATLATQHSVPLIMETKVRDSKGKAIKSAITLGEESVTTELPVQLPSGRYDLTLTLDEIGLPVHNISFHELRTTETLDIGIEPVQDSKFIQAYAIDPTQLEFTNATVTVTAAGTTLYKCAEWNFTAQTCYGEWNVHQTGLTPGETYTFTLTALDPAFGETDSESEPDSCTFNDNYGDTNTDCLTEVLTQDGGYNADMDDHENLGSPDDATMDIIFTNSLFVESINSVGVSFRYQRQADTAVGDTSATIQILDGGSYVTACTDTTITLDTVGWETYNCNLTTWVNNETELNDISIRLITDTGPSGQKKQSGKTYVDLVYITADYVERDVVAPQYSGITTQPISPTTYAGVPSWFNLTWTDNFGITNVDIEHNFTGLGLVNTSMSNISSLYYYTSTLPAGSYVWRSYATDGINLNKTSQYTYVVDKETPPLTLTFNGTSDNITINNSGTINITGANGEGIIEILRETTILTSGTSPLSTLETFNTVGTHNITLRHNETQNYTYDDLTYTVTVIDTIPPGLVTGLDNTSNSNDWLYWTWALPGDTDFDHVEIWLDGLFKENSTSTSYNATALSADTLYNIQIRSVDIHGVKSAFENDTGGTESSTDITPPVITDLSTTDITATSANSSWITDELAGCLLRYGTSSGVYTDSTSCIENKLAQSIILAGLDPSTDYYYRVTATDLAGNNATSPERSFTTLADTTAPAYSDVATQPISPVTYTGGVHWFNVTWTDDVDVSSVTIEHNFTGVGLVNTSMSNISSLYYYSTSMNAGSYVWRIYATDGTNVNKTPQYMYVVDKATPTIALYLDGVEGNNNVNEDSMATLNGTMITPTTGYLYLYYDEGLVDQGNDYVEYTTVYDVPGIYNVTLKYATSTNYEPASTTYWLTVDDTAAPNVTLTSPDIGHNDSDGIIVFTYTVQDDGVLENCSLLINGSIEQVNDTVSAGSNSFTKTDFEDGNYNWNVECYDTASNARSGTARSLIIDKQTITIEIPATSTGPWLDTTTIAISDINANDANIHTYGVPKGTQQYITWTNYTTANIPPGATIIDADFYSYHSGNTRTTFEGVEWYNGAIYAGTGCAPVLQTAAYRTDTCDLSSYIDTVDEANNISLRYLVSAENTGNGGSISINYHYVNITYIKETTAPTFTDIYNVTLDLGESLTAQYAASDNYGISYWTVNDTAFDITTTGLLTNTTGLSEGVYNLLIRAYDPSDNFAETNVIITVTDVVDLNITLDTSGLDTVITVYNSTGGLVSSGTSSIADTVLANELYELVFTTTLTSGPLTTTLHDVNLTQDVNFTSDITETYSGGLPEYITSIGPIYAIDNQGTSFTYAELTIPKAGLDIEYISHCTAWNYVNETCSAWEVNETADYDYAENATHYTINVTTFDAFGGGPGDTLANLTEIRVYDVTDESSNRTGGLLVNNGTGTTFTLGTNRLYRAEFFINNVGKKWVIAGADVAEHTGLNDSWTINTNDIWYGIAGTNYTGGAFTSGTISWDLSLGGTLDQGTNGTWYYVFNTTSLPPSSYPVTFIIEDTNKNSGSTDTSTYEHVYERELVVNSSSLSLSTTTPFEGENVTINMTVHNIGLFNATNFTVELWDNTVGTLLYTENITIGGESSITTQYNWTASTGTHVIELRADTPLTTNGIIVEAFEDNNNYSTQIDVDAWHIFYGSVFEQVVLQGGTTTFHAWPATSVTAANIYAADADSVITWANLQALTRDANNNSASEDLGEADLALNMTGYLDSITATYGVDNSTPQTTDNFTAYGKFIDNVPVVDSTTTSSFQTGILWDTTTDVDGEYDGSEPLVFLTKISPDTIGTYGTYDYEMTLPSALEEIEGTTDAVYFYVEIT